MRLIDADALLKWLSEWELQEAPWWGANGYGDAKVAETIKEAIDAVEQMPTIGLTHGRWVLPKREEHISYDEHAYAECSSCGKKAYLGWWHNFCPNCGAMMDGSEE